MKKFRANLVEELFDDLDLDIYQIRHIKDDIDFAKIVDNIVRNNLRNGEKATFFLLWKCTNTYKEVIKIYSDVYEEIKADSMRKKGDRVRNKVVNLAKKNREINGWKMNWLKTNRTSQALG